MGQGLAERLVVLGLQYIAHSELEGLVNGSKVAR